MYETEVINDEEVAVYKIYEAPKWVGHWIINPSFKIASVKKPTVIHRFFCKHLLGWQWSDDRLDNSVS